MAASRAAPNHRLARLMAEAGFTSHKALARAVREVSAEPGTGGPVGCDHTSVSRWLQGMMPRSETAACIATVLSRALRRPVTLAEAGFASSQAVPPDLGLHYMPVLEDRIDAVGRLCLADLDEVRVVTSRPPDGAAWRDVPLSWLLAARAQATSGDGAASRVGHADVLRVRVTTELFSELDGRFGGGHARHALIQYLASEVSPMLRGSYTDAVRRDMFAAAAQATLLAAWMSYDSGAHGLAQRYFIQALGLADAARDRLLGASILDAMSHQATFLGRFQDAANLARAARLGTASLTAASLSAHFSAMEARALARLGDRRGCELALAEAVRTFEQRNPDDDPPWFRYFDEAELAAELGHCFRDLGQTGAATQHAAQSLGHRCGTRSDFFVTMVLADAHLRAGELEQACEVALRALHLGEHLKSARCAGYLREFGTGLQRSGVSPAVRDFQEQAAVFALWRQATAGASAS